MKKSQLRQLIRQVIKEQFTRPEDELLKRKKSLRRDPRAKIPRPIDMAQPRSASSGCHPNARKVRLENCFDGNTATFGCATVNGGQVPIVGQMIDSGTFSNQIVPKQIILVEDANPGQPGNLDLTLYPDQTATECGYDCLGEDYSMQCEFNGTGTAQFDTLLSCNQGCTPPPPCYYGLLPSTNSPSKLYGAIGSAFTVSGGVIGGPTPVSFNDPSLHPTPVSSYCRFCFSPGNFGSGIAADQHVASMTLPSPSPYFETNQDVCQFLEDNGCCLYGAG